MDSATDRKPNAPGASQPARLLRRDLQSSLGDAASFSVMVGVGESYLPAFVLAVGLGDVAAGLITTVPLLVGALLQLVTPSAVRRLGSHRRWVVACAICQAASFLPLVVAALVGSIPLWAVFLIAAVYWGAGLATGPAWNTWIGTIVPKHLRAKFFAKRTRLSQLGVLVGFLAGGIALQLGSHHDRLLLAFATLFLGASVCRFLSATFLSRQSEPVPPGDDHRDVSVLEFLARFRHRGDGRLLLYLLSVQTAAQIAGPYFTPYMLGPMDLSYAGYMTLMAVSFSTKIVALPAFGAFAHRFGARRLLWLGGVAIVPVSGLWVFSDQFGFILCVQVLAGLSWGAYELAMFLLFFETIHAEERTSVLTTFNFANAVATVLGSFIGGGLLACLGKQPQTYLLLFGLSSVGRALTLVSLVRLPKFELQAQPMSVRTIGVRGGTGSLDQPILPSLLEEGEAGD